MLPIRDAPHGDLCRGTAPATHGFDPGRRGRARRHHEGIQAVEMAAQGRAVHPRAGEISFQNFLYSVARSASAAPRNAHSEPSTRTKRARHNTMSTGAAAAVSAWVPVQERIINFPDYSVDMMASMVKAIEVPDEDEDEQFRIVVFMCENDAYPALDIAGFNRYQYSPFVRVIPVRCLGSVNMVWVREALNGGIDGVMLIGCSMVTTINVTSPRAANSPKRA